MYLFYWIWTSHLYDSPTPSSGLESRPFGRELKRLQSSSRFFLLCHFYFSLLEYFLFARALSPIGLEGKRKGKANRLLIRAALEQTLKVKKPFRLQYQFRLSAQRSKQDSKNESLGEEYRSAFANKFPVLYWVHQTGYTV